MLDIIDKKIIINLEKLLLINYYIIYDVFKIINYFLSL